MNFLIPSSLFTEISVPFYLGRLHSSINSSILDFDGFLRPFATGGSENQPLDLAVRRYGYESNREFFSELWSGLA
jgi:hypothetical protein